MQLNRPVRTRFRYGFPTRVNLATHRKLAGSFFKRHAVTTLSASTQRDAPTACRHTVSGTISLRSRGTFHHSLTVLFAIGRLDILSLTRWSSQIHAGLHGSGATRDDDSRLIAFVYRTLTFCGGPFLNPSTTQQLGNSVLDLVLQLSVPTTPKWQRHQA